MTGSFVVVNLRNAYSNLYKLNVDAFFGSFWGDMYINHMFYH